MICLICLLLGVLSGLPMIFDFLFLLPVATFGGMFFIALKYNRPYLHGLLFSFGYYAVGWHWLANLYPMDFAGFSNFMSVVIIALGISFMSIVQSVGTAFVFKLFKNLHSENRVWLSALTGASLFTLAEWGQNFFWFGIPWAKLALSQTGVPAFLQSASLFGSLFTAFILTFIAACFALAFADGWKKTGRTLAAVSLSVYVLNAAFGFIYMSLPQKGVKLTAAAVQGNISSTDKWADDSLSHSLEIYSDITRRAVKETGAKLVVWPETVITVSLNRSGRVSEIISDLAAELDCDIATGAYYTGENGDSNAIYMFRRSGERDETVYKKRHLVPFGEYIPIKDVVMKLFPFLADVNMFSSEIVPGTDTEILAGSGYRAGALVCFDSIYPALARDSARDGAQVLLISTNDSWFGSSAGVYEHKNQSVLRAIENGKPVVRAANTGVSALIDRYGKETGLLGPLTDGYASGEITLNSSTTLYTRIGDVIAYASAFAVIAAAGLKIGEKIASGRKKKCR